MKYPTDPTYKKWLRSSRWRTLRLQKLTEQPYCEDCLQAHRRTPATEVHHKQPVLSFPTHHERFFMMFNPNNLQSLCKPCHDRKHNRKEQAQHQQERAENHKQSFIEKYSK